jgi:hypothetical protein
MKNIQSRKQLHLLFETKENQQDNSALDKGKLKGKELQSKCEQTKRDI